MQDISRKGRLKVSELEVSFFVHATEDEGRILNALKEHLGLSQEGYKVERLKGYYGNPILLYTRALKGEGARLVHARLLAGLRSNEEMKSSDLMEGWQGERLHLRLDKQALVEGRLRLGQSDIIKLVIRHRGSKREEVLPLYKGILGLD